MCLPDPDFQHLAWRTADARMAGASPNRSVTRPPATARNTSRRQFNWRSRCTTVREVESIETIAGRRDDREQAPSAQDASASSAALDQHLLNQSSTPGADRHPQRHLSLARRRAGDQQARDVRAGDEQHQDGDPASTHKARAKSSRSPESPLRPIGGTHEC